MYFLTIDTNVYIFIHFSHKMNVVIYHSHYYYTCRYIPKEIGSKQIIQVSSLFCHLFLLSLSTALETKLLTQEIQDHGNMAQSRSKLIENVVKGSFHQGDTSVFDQNSVGCQCVANCVIAGLYNSIVLVSNWTSHNLDNILCCGDKLYKSISKTNSLL